MATLHKTIGPGKPPSLSRRGFLVRTGLALGAGVLPAVPARAAPGGRTRIDDWDAVRDQFALARDRIHMAGFFLASHPAPVREAIETHRRGLDADPIGYYQATNRDAIAAVLRAAGEYLGADPTAVALTDSTTMGLGLLYGGFKLRPGQDILTTVHDHYATSMSLALRAERTGAAVREVALYEVPAATSVEEMVDRLRRAVRPETRVVAVTWVHSGTGVKLPIREIARALAEVNADRADEDRALLCVDGVHALGVEEIDLGEVGCDFFVAGCHKWLFGPRGTGLVWGAPHAWAAATATIPDYDGHVYAELAVELVGESPEAVPPAGAGTPGGFHSFEHRWALDQAFRFHLDIGQAAVTQRIRELNRQLKEGLAQLPGVTLHTPMADDLSAGIVCFEVAGLSTGEVVRRLGERRIVASVAPYATRYARLAPSLLTSVEEVDETLAAMADIAGG